INLVFRALPHIFLPLSRLFSFFWNLLVNLMALPGQELFPKYLFYFCLSFNFKALDRSTTIPILAKRDLLNIEMPVPTISKQKCIVARIEELFSQLDASVAELKTAKERLKVYRQAVLKEAFAKYHTFTPLKQVSERIFDGPFGSNLKTADYVEQGIRVVRLENLKNAWFDDTKRSFITKEKYQTISSHTVYPDDLIMSTFMSENIKICQLPKKVGFAVNKADCIGIRLKSDINPHFIMYYLASREAYNALMHQVHGATRPRVNAKQIKAMQIPIAGLLEQNDTVTAIEGKMSICDSIEKTVNTALQQAEALRQSILKKAFEGEF
ncbi:restriction endonuclease subunit S, partial [Oscillibacter sp.]|uniref:restriction endonuclease subunit S n=2 Tax=Oscillibacter TaxID=459786 RepID=UPI002172F6B9